jgi:hypothetical protein
MSWKAIIKSDMTRGYTEQTQKGVSLADYLTDGDEHKQSIIATRCHPFQL